MFKCDMCSREFTTKNGLGLHSKKCIGENSVPTNETVISCTEEVVMSDNDRVIQKLIDKARSTYDAYSRHMIEEEIKRLKNGSVL